jgi:MFS family permease
LDRSPGRSPLDRASLADEAPQSDTSPSMPEDGDGAKTSSHRIQPDQGWEAGVYFGVLIFALTLGSPAGVLAVPLNYFLKDHLKLDPIGMAVFGAIVTAPLYFGFLVGFLRDRWRPAGLGDRGYLLMSAPVAVACYVWLALGSDTYLELLIAFLISLLAFVFIATASLALMTAVGQQQSMTGRLTAVSQVALTLPTGVSFLIGGWLLHRVSPHGSFLVAAAITGVIFVQALWRPSSVFNANTEAVRLTEGGLAAAIRFLKHRPVWPAVVILFLWDFSPGWQTPIFYYLSDHVKISGEQFSWFAALFALFPIPAMILYGFLCRWIPLRGLLWWGTLFAILQGPTALLAQSALSAMTAAALGGLLGGFATAAYFDLLMRACPEGLEGTGYMLAVSGIFVATRSGDLFGSWLYVRGGFVTSIVATTIATALIVLVIPFIPKHLIATREGEEIAGEIGSVV